MFLLDTENLGLSPNEINLINITYYKSKLDILDIYNTNFSIQTCNLPLYVSILEKPPVLISGKKYINIDGETFIPDGKNILPSSSKYTTDNTFNYEYPSFLYDVQTYSQMQNITTYKKNLLKSLDYCNSNSIGTSNSNGNGTSTSTGTGNSTSHNNNNNNNNSLVRIYRLEKQIYIPDKKMLNEEAQIILLWEWEDYVNFQIIINNKLKQVQYQVNITITEEKTLISSKVKTVNNILKKIDKIICYITNNKDL